MKPNLEEDLVVYINPRGEEVVPQTPRSMWQKIGQKTLLVLMMLSGIVLVVGFFLIAIALFIYVVLPIIILFLIWIFFKRWQFQKQWNRQQGRVVEVQKGDHAS